MTEREMKTSEKGENKKKGSKKRNEKLKSPYK
jgi:hypothetical protein